MKAVAFPPTAPSLSTATGTKKYCVNSEDPLLLGIAGNLARAHGGGKGTCAPGGTVQGRHLEGRKYGIIKFDRFWQIGVCIAQ